MSSHWAWTFPGIEASARVAEELVEAAAPRRVLCELAAVSAGMAPRLVDVLGLSPSSEIEKIIGDLSPSELYRLAIADFLVDAPKVRNHRKASRALLGAGHSQLAAVRVVYGDELDELPGFYGGSRFQSLWCSMAEPLTTRRGWLPAASLDELADMVSRTMTSGPIDAVDCLADLERLLLTGIARGHDLLIVTDP